MVPVDGTTAGRGLIAAAQANQLQEVHRLLAGGIDVHHETTPALGVATSLGHSQVAGLLLSYPFKADAQGISAMDTSVQLGSATLVKMFARQALFSGLVEVLVQGHDTERPQWLAGFAVVAQQRQHPATQCQEPQLQEQRQLGKPVTTTAAPSVGKPDPEGLASQCLLSSQHRPAMPTMWIVDSPLWWETERPAHLATLPLQGAYIAAHPSREAASSTSEEEDGTAVALVLEAGCASQPPQDARYRSLLRQAPEPSAGVRTYASLRPCQRAPASTWPFADAADVDSFSRLLALGALHAYAPTQPAAPSPGNTEPVRILSALPHLGAQKGQPPALWSERHVKEQDLYRAAAIGGGTAAPGAVHGQVITSAGAGLGLPTPRQLLDPGSVQKLARDAVQRLCDAARLKPAECAPVPMGGQVQQSEAAVIGNIDLEAVAGAVPGAPGNILIPWLLVFLWLVVATIGWVALEQSCWQGLLLSCNVIDGIDGLVSQLPQLLLRAAAFLLGALLAHSIFDSTFALRLRRDLWQRLYAAEGMPYVHAAGLKPLSIAIGVWLLNYCLGYRFLNDITYIWAVPLGQWWGIAAGLPRDKPSARGTPEYARLGIKLLPWMVVGGLVTNLLLLLLFPALGIFREIRFQEVSYWTLVIMPRLMVGYALLAGFGLTTLVCLCIKLVRRLGCLPQALVPAQLGADIRSLCAILACCLPRMLWVSDMRPTVVNSGVASAGSELTSVLSRQPVLHRRGAGAGVMAPLMQDSGWLRPLAGTPTAGGQVAHGQQQDARTAASSTAELRVPLLPSGDDMEAGMPSTLRVRPRSEPWMPCDAVEVHEHQELGHGALGKVLRGRYKGQDVAVKVLRQDLPVSSAPRVAPPSSSSDGGSSVWDSAPMRLAAQLLRTVYPAPSGPSQAPLSIAGEAQDASTALSSRAQAGHLAGHLAAQLQLNVVGQLDHPNIARTYGACNALSGPVLLVQELCLYSLYSCKRDEHRAQPPALREVLGLSIGMASGLRYLHSNSELHSDLTPRNIMISAQCTAKIADTGLAYIKYSRHLLTFNCDALDIRYMAPESVLCAGAGSCVRQERRLQHGGNHWRASIPAATVAAL